MKKFTTICLSLLIIFQLQAQKPAKDKGIFREYKPGFYQNHILKGIQEYESVQNVQPPDRRFKMNMEGYKYPNNIELYKTMWYNEPVSQGNTSTCWCFSATSFYESEIYRTTGQKVKLSEMYTVYWEYVEKARRFVRERGNSAFGEGSEGNAVTRIWKSYGIVPAESYSGQQIGQSYHNHTKMFEEMDNYLKWVKSANAWNEDAVLETIKSIMNRYMGEPPQKVIMPSRILTPLEYMYDILKLNPDDYIDVTSLLEKPYWQKVEYDVPDNWWHCDQYYNLPLDDYMKVLKNAVRNGYTVAIGGDVSEPGLETSLQVAVVPSFDIPSEYIDENARQMRFSNGSTTDDHGVHIVGYYEKDGKDWYLIKDSGAGSRNVGKESKSFGHYFFHEDYVKLKMMDFMVHKDALKDYMERFIK